MHRNNSTRRSGGESIVCTFGRAMGDEMTRRGDRVGVFGIDIRSYYCRYEVAQAGRRAAHYVMLCVRWKQNRYHDLVERIEEPIFASPRPMLASDLRWKKSDLHLHFRRIGSPTPQSTIVCCFGPIKLQGQDLAIHRSVLAAQSAGIMDSQRRSEKEPRR